MGFAGDGGPPPPDTGGGGSKDDPMFSIYENVTKANDKGEVKTYKKRIKTWSVKKGAKDKPILMLDSSSSDRYTCKVHDFTGPDGKWGSILRCVATAYPEKGCPICDALEVFIAGGGGGQYPKSSPAWAWALTGIDRSTFTPTEGKNKGKVYTDNRRLVLVTEYQYTDMVGLEEKESDGYRGRTFDVSRADVKTSYKIGTQWYPTNAGNVMTDEQMHDEFAKRAKDYGLPVDQFCAPFNYDELLKLPTYEEAVAFGERIKSGSKVEVPTGDTEAISF